MWSDRVKLTLLAELVLKSVIRKTKQQKSRLSLATARVWNRSFFHRKDLPLIRCHSVSNNIELYLVINFSIRLYSRKKQGK